MTGPVKYQLRLRLNHQYAGPADGARHIVHVAPLDLPGRQSVQSVAVTATPNADMRSDRVDFFGNAVTQFAHRTSHGAMQIEMTAQVTCHPTGAQGDTSPLLGALPDKIAAYRGFDAAAPYHFLGASARITLPETVAEYARGLADREASVLANVTVLGQALHADMNFDSMATTVDTSLEDAFAHRHGVCQDFAHIMIAGLRSLGIPARYVSGFLRTEPPAGQPRLEGADAMHAWVSAWCGADMGWVEFDPTNNVPARTDHIVVGYGRDYDDVAPIKGVLRSSGMSSVGQAVDVIPVPVSTP